MSKLPKPKSYDGTETSLTFCVSLEGISINTILVLNLTHFRPMFHFYTPRKRQKIEGFSDVFRGVWKCDIGLEWIKKPLTKKCVKHIFA